MALEIFEGFEGGNTASVSLTYWTWTQNAVTANNGRGGGYCIENTATNGSVTIFPPASARKTIGFACYMDHTSQWGVSSWLLSIYSSGTQHLTLTFDATGHVHLRLGTQSGTILYTTTQTFTLGAYHYVEVQSTIADSGGTCILRVDGVEWINYTGDTKLGGTTTTIDKFIMATSGTGNRRLDDVYVVNETDDTATTGRPDNTFLGDVKVVRLAPNGNGTTSQWSGSDGDSTDNYLLLDEVPPNTTDYVASSTIGARDMWELGDAHALTTTVYAVQPHLYVQKNDSGAASVKSILRTAGGSEHVSADIPLTTGWLNAIGTMHTTRPGGGAWTLADLNGLQLGVERS